MAISPTLSCRAMFQAVPGRSLYSQGDVSPLTPEYREPSPQLMDNSSAPQSSCTCAKAKVIAAMALSLLVYDAKLDAGRDRWACPFAKCKNDFLDAKALMHHVPSCRHFSSDEFYCNCCCAYHEFADQTPDGHAHCGVDAAPSTTTDEPSTSTPKKAMRKFTHLFTRSRPGSRSSSSRSFSPSASASSGTDSRRSVSLQSIQTQHVLGATRNQSAAPLSELPSASVTPSSFTNLQSGSGSGSGSPSAPCELYDTAQVPELSGLDYDPNSHIGQGSLPTISPISIPDAMRPIFIENEDFTASPVDDESMDSKIPDFSIQATGNSGFRQDVVRSQEPCLSAGFAQSAVPSLADQQHYPPSMVAQNPVSLSHFNLQQSLHATPDIPFFAGDIPESNQAGVSMFDLNPPFQHTAPFSGQFSPSITARQGSGDSAISALSHHDAVSQQPKPREQSITGQQSIFNGIYGAVSGSPLNILPTPPAPFDSLPTEITSDKCPYCDHRPGGKAEQREAYLRRHIKNVHQSSPIPCPRCRKDYTRSDNLNKHLKFSCTGPWQSGRRPAEEDMGHSPVDREYYPPPKRQRHGPIAGNAPKILAPHNGRYDEVERYSQLMKKRNLIAVE